MTKELTKKQSKSLSNAWQSRNYKEITILYSSTPIFVYGQSNKTMNTQNITRMLLFCNKNTNQA